jgi:nucleoside-diphosphate-sugar epimerase
LGGSELKVLVTGATGFTGGHLVRKLLDEGDEVRAVVRSEEMARLLLNELPVHIVEGDLRDLESLYTATEGIDIVYHIAALYREAGFPEKTYHDINAGGTENLLKASIENKVKKFVHCSTVGVLGNIDNPPADENTAYNPGDEYQRSKLEGELIALRYHKEFNIPVTVIRPAAIYGPGDTRLLKLFKMISRKKAVILGDGETFYHMVYINDLIKGILLASRIEKAVGEVFIIAGEAAVTLTNLYQLIANALSVPLKTITLPVKPVKAFAAVVEKAFTAVDLRPPIYKRRVDFFTKDRSFDISKAKTVLGYKPGYTLEMGIERTAEWYKLNNLL